MSNTNNIMITKTNNLNKLVWSIFLCFLLVWVALTFGIGIPYYGVQPSNQIESLGYEKKVTKVNNNQLLYTEDTLDQMTLEVMRKNKKSNLVSSSVQTPYFFYMVRDNLLIQHQNNINFFQPSSFLSYIPQGNVPMAITQLYKHVQSISSSILQLAEQLANNHEFPMIHLYHTINIYNSYL